MFLYLQLSTVKFNTFGFVAFGRSLSEKGTRGDDRTRLEHEKEPSGYKLERRQTSFNCNDRIP